MVIDSEVITVTDTPVGLTPSKLINTDGSPKWITNVTLGIENASIRVTRTGVEPDNTSNIGHVFPSGTVVEIEEFEDLQNLLMIRVGGSDAKVYVEFEVK